MSEQNHDYLGGTKDPNLQLKANVLMLQLKGAGYAAAFCLITVITIYVIYGIGLLLPEESREAADPTPLSYVLPQEEVTRA
ncbi:MAG: RC-LH1 core complex protein PufX [Litoreibacter sp.]|nr:RC-LH1 core complex protein PufX [Litoreibacter sp.]